MGWLEDLEGKTVGLDTAPLILYIENHSDYGKLVDPFFEAVESGVVEIVTSTITLLEVMVHPLRNKDEALAYSYYEILLRPDHVKTIAVTPATAMLAAEIRAEHNLKTPDSIQPATAIQQKADAFLTNDRDFDHDDRIQVLKVHELMA